MTSHCRTVLVTGGAGYVGSHCAKAFFEAGWKVVTLDNLTRGWREAVKWGPLIVGDIADQGLVTKIIEEHKPDVIAHFAAYAYVGESVEFPEIYYENNVAKTHALLEAVRRGGGIPFLFSSTCATYGHPKSQVIDENHPQWPINPYGWSKFVIERMLSDYAVAHEMSSIALRYFNAAGCDPDGEIGERHEPETHAIPLAIEAALKAGSFSVFGTDFDTRDGSAVRDYIHVCDLASAHVLAAERLAAGVTGADVFNLGTGTGTSVLEMVDAIKRIVSDQLDVKLADRRAGDPASLVADPRKANDLLGWTPQSSSIDNIVETAARWHRRN